MKKVLTIAGSDCSGGAGIQADMKTMTVHGVYAMSVITAITAQNTTGVYGVMDIDLDMIESQIDCVFQDIRPDAVKIGMVSSIDIIELIARKLKEYDAKNIVVDPVMFSTSGHSLLSDDAMSTLIDTLIPIADIITPNISESKALANLDISTKEGMTKAGKQISKTYDGYILIKGGHLISDADDLLYSKDKHVWMKGRRIDNNNTHGTGCTLSSAIVSNLALGYGMQQSVERAKQYVAGAIADGLDIGKGDGPLNHSYLVHERI